MNLAARALQRLETDGALRLVDAGFARLLRGHMGADDTVALAGALAMRAVALGHSGFVLRDVAALLDELGAAVALPEHDAWVAALRTSALVVDHADAAMPAPLVFEHGRVALRRYARYEQALATQLRARASSIVLQPLAADPCHWLAPRLATLFDDPTQAEAARVALAGRLTLITGGPGTGKTTTVARILALLFETAARAGEPPPRIALAAPTGRAAARLGEAIAAVLAHDLATGHLEDVDTAAIPREAQTLHRLLGWQPGRIGFRHHAGHLLPFDAVVVDEASMIDLPLMAKLVAAVPPQGRLILLGDPDQLPAVEAGDVLGTLCAASDRDPALAARRVHLLRGYRQSGASSLGELAHAIRDGDSASMFALLHDAARPQVSPPMQPSAASAPSTDPLPPQGSLLDSRAQARDNRSPGEGVLWQSGNANALAHALRDFALPAYAQLAQAADPALALQRADRMRVLCALREGPFGARAWNAWFAEQLRARGPWFRGRLLLITANSYRHGLFNGDTGVVWDDADGEPVVWFEQGGALRAWRPAQLPAYDSAFATTVHKAQGSEFDRIALLLPEADARVLSRELIYTAVTRARATALLWASADILEHAIARRSHRDSGLLARLTTPA